MPMAYVYRAQITLWRSLHMERTMVSNIKKAHRPLLANLILDLITLEIIRRLDLIVQKRKLSRLFRLSKYAYLADQNKYKRLRPTLVIRLHCLHPGVLFDGIPQRQGRAQIGASPLISYTTTSRSVFYYYLFILSRILVIS